MKSKEIVYVNTDDNEEVKLYLSNLFEKAITVRDLSQEIVSEILHLRSSIQKTEYDRALAKAGK